MKKLTNGQFETLQRLVLIYRQDGGDCVELQSATEDCYDLIDLTDMGLIQRVNKREYRLTTAAKVMIEYFNAS